MPPRRQRRAFPVDDGVPPTNGSRRVDDPIEDDDEADDDATTVEEGQPGEEPTLLGSDDEDDGEDLFGGDVLRRDYESRPQLDQYDPSLVDDSAEGVVRELSVGEVRRVDEMLNVRDHLRAGDGPPPGGGGGRYRLQSLLEEDEDEDNDLWRRIRERREQMRSRANEDSGGDAIPVQQAEEANEELPYCTSSGSNAWCARVQEILAVVFRGFICYYKRPERQVVNFGSEGGREGVVPAAAPAPPQQADSTYIQAIHAMVHEDSSSLNVSWDDIRRYSPKALDWIFRVPGQCLSLLSEAATDATVQKYPRLYGKRVVVVRLRAYDIVESLRALTTQNLNTLVCVRGVVIRRSNIEPRLARVFFQCLNCGCDSLGPFYLKAGEKRPRLICEDCQRSGPFQISREKTLYENYQTLVLQEPSNAVAPGCIPKQKQVIVSKDLVDKTKPGDEIVVTGIYETKPDSRLNASSGFPVFATHILANNIEKQRELDNSEITETDLEIFRRLARNPHIREKIIDSIAPSIWGHRHIKTGLAYAMLGGVQRRTEAGHTIRGDINVLLLGDPGVGKSQFLKYVERTFDRTIYTTGKGSTAVGLTAAVRRDEHTGEWCLEGGALVLADEGICLIDEFDKMSEQDRVSIHEAMEQQSISISKAGIVASLKARCSIIAAANPVGGRYDSSLTFMENVDLTTPILTRFDILAVVKDQVHPMMDELLAQHIVESHANSTARNHSVRLTLNTGTSDRRGSTGTGNAEEDIENAPIEPDAPWVRNAGRIPQEVLRKYILYARRNCRPQFVSSADEAMLTKFYIELRQASQVQGGAAVTVRHLESTLRMATANARMRLSNFVERRDLQFAISTMVESFIQTQKYAMAVQLGRKFGRYRAIASSPHEFVESVLLQQIANNTRKLLHAKRVGGPGEGKDAEDGTGGSAAAVQAAVQQAEVPFDQLVCLLRAMYNIPAGAVAAYRDSARFRRNFKLITRTAADGTEQLVIQRGGGVAAPVTTAAT